MNSMLGTPDSTGKSSEGIKLVIEFVVLMIVIFIYAIYIVLTHPESMIGFVFLFVGAIFSFVIFTQQYMAVVFERRLIEKIENIDVDTLARIEKGIRNKLLTGKNKNNVLAELKDELDKGLKDSEKEEEE